MYEFSQAQRFKALCWLSFWHMLVIVTSNYLVQFPFTIGELSNTWGVFTYPFIFLTTDLTVRIFGALLARRIIFWVMLPSLLLSYGVSVIFDQGHWAGFAHLAHFNVAVARIALASFSAYVIGQLMDIIVFNRLRQLSAWWIAPAVSTVVGGAVDTVVFFFIAFHQSTDAFMAANWPHIALGDYAFKISVAALFFLPAYGVILRFLLRKLTALPQPVRT